MSSTQRVTRSKLSSHKAGQQSETGTAKMAGEEALVNINKQLEALGPMAADIGAIRQEISELRTSVNNSKQTAEDALNKAEECETNFNGLRDNFITLDLKFKKLEAENKSLREQMYKTEAQERRNNLIIDGCKQNDGETKQDCINKVYGILSDKLKIENVHEIKIERCHRLQMGKPQQPKPIIFKLLYYSDRERIWNSRRNLKETNASSDEKIFLSEDFPNEIKKRRRFLEPIRRKAQEQHMKAFLTYDKLVIDGHSYTVDTVDELPGFLHPSELATRRSETHTGFFTGASPLSNFHKCSFTDREGMTWSSVEQYYQYQKCMHHAQSVKARQVLESDEPSRCAFIGKQVHVTDQKNWEDKSKEIMYEGCLYKFTQNDRMKSFLLDTKETELVEANPGDVFWSVGLGIKDPNLFDASKWKGSNVLGKTLKKVRDQLK